MAARLVQTHFSGPLRVEDHRGYGWRHFLKKRTMALASPPRLEFSFPTALPLFVLPLPVSLSLTDSPSPSFSVVLPLSCTHAQERERYRQAGRQAGRPTDRPTDQPTDQRIFASTPALLQLCKPRWFSPSFPLGGSVVPWIDIPDPWPEAVFLLFYLSLRSSEDSKEDTHASFPVTPHCGT